MGFCMNRIFIISSMTLIMVIGIFNSADTFGEDNIAKQKLLGIWWTQDSNDTPWAIQFNENGTFRTAQTILRLEKLPIDEGQFLLQGTSLTLISNKDCDGSCKGLQGIYNLELTKYGDLIFEEQKELCMERREICSYPWTKVIP